MSLRPFILATTLLGGALLAAPALHAGTEARTETWTVAGRTYERVRVLEVTPGAVMIAHAGGMVQLDLEKLPPELQARFGYDADRAAEWRRAAETGMAATDALRQREAAEKKRRAELEAVRERIARRAAESDPDYVEFRPEVDLRPVFTDYSLYLRNQGARPSCSIFALVSALEYEYARRRGQNEALSEEYLIWAFQKMYPGKPVNDGYNFGQLLHVLRTCGIARRSVLPDSFAAYLKDQNPPLAALDDAVTRRDFQTIGIDPGDELALAKIVHLLNSQTPVVIGIKWPPPAVVDRTHLLKDQAPQTGAAHAVMLVGYTSHGTPESVVFTFRNSYGPQWGLGGYGLMDRAYLKKHLVTAFSVVVPAAEEPR